MSLGPLGAAARAFAGAKERPPRRAGAGFCAGGAPVVGGAGRLLATGAAIGGAVTTGGAVGASEAGEEALSDFAAALAFAGSGPPLNAAIMMPTTRSAAAAPIAIRRLLAFFAKGLSTSSGSVHWEGLRPVIRSALLGKPLRVAPKSRGLRVTVRVEASEQFPGGGRPPAPAKMGAALHGDVGKVTETREHEHVAIELPSVALTYQSRNCGGGIVVGPAGLSAGAGCNPGVAMRVVSARIVGEERL